MPDIKQTNVVHDKGRHTNTGLNVYITKLTNQPIKNTYHSQSIKAKYLHLTTFA